MLRDAVFRDAVYVFYVAKKRFFLDLEKKDGIRIMLMLVALGLRFGLPI
jgi:hypothetical protein